MRFPMKNGLAILAAAAAIVILAGCKKGAAPPAPAGPLPVNVVVAEEKEVPEWDEYTGRTEAVEAVDIRARVTGYLTEIHFKAGAIVKKGDQLFTIDPRPYKADLDKAAAEVERTTAQAAFAEDEFNRAKELRAKNTISASDLDNKGATFRQADAAKKSADAARAAAALNLEFTDIRSPIDGRVSNERITVGNLVSAGSGAESILTSVVSVDPIYVYVDVDENALLRYIKLTTEGKRKSAREERTPLYCGLANEPGFPHEGYIDFVDNKVDPNTGTMRVRGVFKTWDSLVTPGFFMRVRVAATPPGPAVLLPDEVILRDQSTKFAWVAKDDGTAERRTVQTGSYLDGRRVVRSGVKGGEKVISTRLQILQQGMKVQVVPADAPKKDAAAPPPAK